MKLGPVWIGLYKTIDNAIEEARQAGKYEGMEAQRRVNNVTVSKLLDENQQMHQVLEAMRGAKKRDRRRSNMRHTNKD